MRKETLDKLLAYLLLIAIPVAVAFGWYLGGFLIRVP
jgi:hypothetical protein